MTFNNRRAHAKPLFKSLNILKLESLYTFETAKVMYQLCNYSTHNINDNANDYLTINRVHSYNTRQSAKDNMFTQRARISQAQKSLQYAGIKI